MSGSQNEDGSNGEYYLLPDEEIDSSGDDEFGRRKYAQTLKTIIEKVDPPFNIGLFGPWGSGKSSVVKLLFNSLKEEKNEYICVNFDAWKHAEGSVRTELLLQIDELIGAEIGEYNGVLGERAITSQLYDVTEEIRSNLSTLWRNLVKNPLKIILYVTLYAVGFFIAGIAYWYGSLAQSLGIISAILGISVIKELISYVAKPQIQALNPRKEWSGAYEKIFHSIVNKSLDREDNFEKLVIGIDNLDRCEPEIAYEVLISVKTFMENENCIFVIACDEEALISHISQKADADENFGREFLRKMFQTQLRIPKLEAENIEEFIDEQNNALQEKLSHEVLEILYKAKIKNPRKIKQVLNNIVVLRELAGKLETSGKNDEDPEIKRNTVTSNLDFLAKILVLQEFFPIFYQRLEKNKFLLRDMRDYFDLNVDEREEKYGPLHQILNNSDHSINKSLGATLKSFLRETRVNDVDDIDPFIDLADPSHKDSESISVFQEAIYDSDEFRNNFHPEQIKDIEPYTSILRKELFECYQNERFEELKEILISSVKLATDYKKGREEIYEVVVGRLLTLINQNPDDLNDFPIDPLFELLTVNQDRSKEIFIYLARLISSKQADDNFNVDILKAFISYYEKISNGQVAENVSSSISEFFEDDVAPQFEMALKILRENEDALEKYVHPHLFEGFSKTLEWYRHEEPRIRNLRYYMPFDDLMTGDRGVEIRSQIVSKITDLIGNAAEHFEENSLEAKKAAFNQLNKLNSRINKDAMVDLMALTIRIITEDYVNENLLNTIIDFQMESEGDPNEPIDGLLEMAFYLIPLDGDYENLDSGGVEIDQERILNFILDQMLEELSNEDGFSKELKDNFEGSVENLIEKRRFEDYKNKYTFLTKVYSKYREILSETRVINDLSSFLFQKTIQENNEKLLTKEPFSEVLSVIFDDLKSDEQNEWKEALQNLRTSKNDQNREIGRKVSEELEIWEPDD